jgi:hypothetical protein
MCSSDLRLGQGGSESVTIRKRMTRSEVGSWAGKVHAGQQEV